MAAFASSSASVGSRFSVNCTGFQPPIDVRNSPAGTPAAITRRIYDASARVLRLPDVEQAVTRQGLEISLGTAQELASRIKAESAVVARIVRQANIRAD